MEVTGFFVGVTTVDLHYLVDGVPGANTKSVAAGFGLSTGGPATNAAVTFSYLGGRSCLCSAIGQHAFTRFMSEELAALDIEVLELAPESRVLPPFSTILTTKGSGERAVIAYVDERIADIDDDLPDIDLADFDILLLDGFQMPVAQAAAAQARTAGVPVVLDAGSWKEGMESLLGFVDVAICSADFTVPDSSASSEPKEVLDYLAARGVRYGAITREEKAILFYNGQEYGEVQVKPVDVVDTLGAGDIYHGAFCYYFARGMDFVAALRDAAPVAGRSCEFFGTRTWMRSGETTNNCQIANNYLSDPGCRGRSGH